MPIDAMTEKIGCQDGITLRKLVKREFGTTPGGIRCSALDSDMPLTSAQAEAGFEREQ